MTFAYDLTDIDYQEAHIDFGTDDQPILVPLTSPKDTLTQTFTHPQGRDIKVFVDGKMKRFLLGLNSKGWYVLLGKFYEVLQKKQGVLHYPVDKVPASVIKDGEFYLSYEYVSDFDYDADNLIFETRLKNPQSEGGISCFDVSIDLNGETNRKRGILSFNLLNKGCEKFASIRVGKTKLPIPGSNQKLINSGVDLSDWVTVKAMTNNHILTIFVNGEKRHTVPYRGQIGTLKFMRIGFKGTGSVDWIRVRSLDNELLYQEDFNSPSVSQHRYGGDRK